MSLEQIRENYYRLEAKYDELWERVRKLEEGIRLHKDLMEQDQHEIYAADEELWQLIEKQEGVGDGTSGN